jgi:DNA repair exonuclease SbcCD nuclease subunit
VYVVDRDREVIELKKLDTAVLCLPHNVLAEGGLGTLEPRGNFGTHILTMHATVRGEEVDHLLGYVGEFGGAQVEISDIRVDRWDYIALGHYHIATPLAPNMWYSGSLERTATNIWIETSPKGFVTYDTDEGHATFHAVPTRPIVDLARISARTDDDAFLAPDELDARIRKAVDGVPGGIDSKLVRLILEDVPRELYRELDHKRLREYRARALHFHLDVRRPHRRRLATPDIVPRRVSLEEEAEAFLVREWQPSGRDIQRTRLVSLARQYLAEAARDTGDPLLAEPQPSL